MAYIGQGLSEGRRQLYNFTVAAGQSVFPVSYDAGFIDVFVNGVLLMPADYTATDGASVTITGLSAGDEVTMNCHRIFAPSDTVSASTGGTFSGPVKFASGIIENNSNITADYNISANYNAISAGTIDIDSDVTVTIPDGSTWTIV